MSTHRQSVREYMQASETLLKANDLSDEEMEAVQEMLNRISDKLLTSLVALNVLAAWCETGAWRGV